MSPILGCVADDLTGATDLALMLKRNGMSVVQMIGVPSPATAAPDADAIVVALKSRTIPAQEAVEMSLASLEWLKAAGCRQYLFKYCSTFDSTDRGNIGPVTDAMMTNLQTGISIACPAFPENRRTVYQGHLFVGDRLLSESPLKDHPLTPMTDADLVRVLQRQSRAKVGLVAFETVEAGADAIATALDSLAADGPAIAIVDAVSDRHLETIGRAVSDLPLLTGGSGIAMGLPENYRMRGWLRDTAGDDRFAPPSGRTLCIAGSCSKATRGQIAEARTEMPVFDADAERILKGEPVLEEARAWLGETLAAGPALVCSSDDPAHVADIQSRYGREHAGETVERFFADLARSARDIGVDRFVVAGGETSGAVVGALGAEALRIGPEIDPGVPWTVSTGDAPVALALKSGNFGGPDFFTKAIGMLP